MADKNNFSQKKNEIQLLQASSFKGPLPHPDILKGYDDIVKGAAGRIITMAEEEAKHRREMEKKAVDSYNFNYRVFLFSATLIVIVSLSGSFVLIFTGRPLEGFAALILAVGVILSRMWFERRNARDE